MKTPRFFIALATLAFVFTTALSSIDFVVRPARAETLPVLRVDPRAGGSGLPRRKAQSSSRRGLGRTARHL